MGLHYKRRNKRIALPGLLACLWLTACAVPLKKESLTVEGLVFKNRSFDDLVEVRLTVEATREFIACGYIPARGECSTTFPRRDYQGNPVIVSWQQGSREYASRERPEPPSHPVAGKPLSAVIVIRADGEVDAQLVH